MEHPDPSPQTGEPGDHRRTSSERQTVAGLAPHLGEHHFEHPTVAPVSRPVTPPTQQW